MMDINNITNAVSFAHYEELEQQKRAAESCHKRILEEGSIASQKSLEYLQAQIDILSGQNKILSDGSELAKETIRKNESRSKISLGLSIAAILAPIIIAIVQYVNR